jgi:hypothetical protein
MAESGARASKESTPVASDPLSSLTLPAMYGPTAEMKMVAE